MDVAGWMERLGIESQVALAAALGVTPAAVTNWVVRGIPKDAQMRLEELVESGGVYEAPPFGSIVRVGGVEYRVVRRSRHECLSKKPMQWTLGLAPVRREKGVLWHTGPVREFPANLAVLVEAEVEWVAPDVKVKGE